MKMRTLLNLFEDGAHKFPSDPWLDASKITQVVYHQTHRDNVNSISTNGFDVSRVGARGNDDEMPDGIFFKPSDADVGVGGVPEDVAQMKFHIRLVNPLYARDREALLYDLRKDPEYQRLKQVSSDTDQRLTSAYEKLEQRDYAAQKPGHRGFAPGFKAKYDKLFKQGDILGKRLAAACRARITAYLREKGYDGVVVQNDRGSLGRVVTTYVILDPKQARAVTTEI